MISSRKRGPLSPLLRRKKPDPGSINSSSAANTSIAALLHGGKVRRSKSKDKIPMEINVPVMDLGEQENLKLQLRDSSRVVRAVLGENGKLDESSAVRAVRKLASMQRELKRLRKQVKKSKADEVVPSITVPEDTKQDEENNVHNPPIVSPTEGESYRKPEFPPASPGELAIGGGFLALGQNEHPMELSDTPDMEVNKVEIAETEEELTQQSDILKDLLLHRERRIDKLQADLEANSVTSTKSATSPPSEDNRKELKRLLEEARAESQELERGQEKHAHEIVELGMQLRGSLAKVEALTKTCEEGEDRIEELESENFEGNLRIDELAAQLEESEHRLKQYEQAHSSREDGVLAGFELLNMHIKGKSSESGPPKEMETLRLQAAKIREMKQQNIKGPEVWQMEDGMRDQAARLLLAQLLDRDAKLDRMALDLQSKESELEGLRLSNSEKAPLESSDERIKQLEADNKDANVQIAVLAEQLNKSSAAVEEFMLELDEIREEEVETKKELISLRSQLEEAKAVASKAVKELAIIRSGGAEYTSSEVEKLTGQLDEALASVQGLKKEVDAKHEIEKSQLSEKSELMSQLVITQAIHTSISTTMSEARMKRRPQEADIDDDLLSTGSIAASIEMPVQTSMVSEENANAKLLDSRLLSTELEELRSRLQEAQGNIEDLEQERNYNLAKVIELNRLLEIDSADETKRMLHSKAMECAELNAHVTKLTDDLEKNKANMDKLEQEREVYKLKVEEMSNVWETHTKAIEAEKHLRLNLQEVERLLGVSRQRSQQLDRERELTIEKAASLSIELAESRARVDDLSEQLAYERRVFSEQRMRRRSRHGLGASSIHSGVSALSMQSVGEELNFFETLDEEEPMNENGDGDDDDSASTTSRSIGRLFRPFGRARRKTSTTEVDEAGRIKELESIVARQERAIATLRCGGDAGDDMSADGDASPQGVEFSSFVGEDADAAAGSVVSAGSALTREQAQDLTIQRLMKQVEETDIVATQDPATANELLALVKKLQAEKAEYSDKVQALQSTLEEVAHENVARSIKIMALEKQYRENPGSSTLEAVTEIPESPQLSLEPSEQTLNLSERELEDEEDDVLVPVSLHKSTEQGLAIR